MTNNIRKTYSEEEKKALEKQKQLYEDSYKNEDYEDNLSEAENNIATINSDLMSAIKSQNQSAIKDLQEEKANAIKELNDLVTDKERENASSVFDKALEDLDSQKEDILSTQNLTKLVTEAMQNGFISVNGEVISLSDSMNTFLKESVVGVQNLNLELTDTVNTIKDAIAGLSNLGSISIPSLDTENWKGSLSNVSNVSNNSSNSTTNKLYTFNPTFNNPITINGSVNNDTYSAIRKEFESIAKNESTKALNEFVKYVNGQ